MITFGRLTDIIKNGRTLNQNKVLFFVMSKDENKEFVIELNTEEQLFHKGIDSEGVRLEDIGGEYSEYTVFLKQSDNLPADRITLYQTGDFYDTFNVVVEKDGFIIEANTIKGGDDLQDRWGDDILGLTDDSIQELIEFIIPQVIERVLYEILR